MPPSHPRNNTEPVYCIGHGYDLHRLEPRPPQGHGRVLILGGVRFEEHPAGPISHSDGDAVYHAVTDAILGALGLPDIGQLFPDDDPRNESADSAIFLKEAAAQSAARGFAPSIIDITVVCERPKVGPHAAAMRERIAQACGVGIDAVSVKATTSEKLGFTGRGEGIAAQAVALLHRA